jgi:hypothetical protein
MINKDVSYFCLNLFLDPQSSGSPEMFLRRSCPGRDAHLILISSILSCLSLSSRKVENHSRNSLWPHQRQPSRRHSIPRNFLRRTSNRRTMMDSISGQVSCQQDICNSFQPILSSMRYFNQFCQPMIDA